MLRPRALLAVPVALALAAVAVAVVSSSGGGGDDDAAEDDASTSNEVGSPGRVPVAEGRAVVGSLLTLTPGEAGYCSGGGPGQTCSVLQLTLGSADQSVRADGVVTRWSVRGGKGGLALQAIDGRQGRRRVVARGPTVRATGARGETFAVRIPVDRGQRLGVELAKDGFLPFRYRDEGASKAEFYEPPLGTTPTAPEADASGTSGYEFLYNATVEPDDDRDGRGDLTQDPDHGGAGAECPKAGVLARGSGSSAVRVGDQLFGCRGGVRTLVGRLGGRADYGRFRFRGDQLALVRTVEGKSTVQVFDLGDRRRTFSTSKTSDDDRPANWKVTALAVAASGDAAWMATPRGARDRTGLWTRNGRKVQQVDSGSLEPGSLRVADGEDGVEYTDLEGRRREAGF
jgi:hypothetical protein